MRNAHGYMLTVVIVLAAALVQPTPAAPPVAGETPFQKEFASPSASFTVPQGQRLVVQYIAGSTLVPTGRQLAGRLNGQTATDVDEMFVPLAFSRESIFPTQDRLTVAQFTLFYVDEGQTVGVSLQCLPLSETFDFSGSLTVTGFLVKK